MLHEYIKKQIFQFIYYSNYFNVCRQYEKSTLFLDLQSFKDGEYNSITVNIETLTAFSRISIQ